MKIRKTLLPGVLILTPEIFKDHRGEYVNLWNAKTPVGLDAHWKEDDLSKSKHGVIRGFHGDESTYKLVSCLLGSLVVVVVVADPKNKHYLKWEMFQIDEFNRKQLFIPPKYGLAHQVLSDEALFWYKQSQLYLGAQNQFTIHPLDPALCVPWPIKNPILSERDKNAPFLGTVK